MGGQRATQASEAAAIASGYIDMYFTPVGQRTILKYTDRKIVIEDVKLSWATAASAGVTALLASVTETQKTAQADLSDHTEITDTVAVDGTALVKNSATLLPTNSVPYANIVGANSYLVLVLSAVPGTLAGVTVTIRYSTVIK